MKVIIRPIRPEEASRWEALRRALWPDGADDHAQEIAAFFAGSAAEPQDARGTGRLQSSRMTAHSEPNLVTDPALAGVLEELKRQEPIFHRPELGTTRAHFESMTHPDFWETGASGRRYSREFVLSLLEERYAKDLADEWKTQEFQCRRLAGEVYLLTYTLFQGPRMTRRATIWERTPQGWRIVYHQGTMVQDA